MSRWSRTRWMALIMLSLCLVLGLSSVGCSAETAPQVGAKAPGFSLTTLGGGTVELDDLKGKPVVINFWATWCGWCRYHMPFFQAAYEERGDEVTFIAINMRESGDRVAQFVESEGIGFTVALDSNGAVSDAYNVWSVPITFFIDADGVIRYIKSGAFISESAVLAVLDSLQ